MNAASPPPEEKPFIARPLGFLTRGIVRAPRAVLYAALALAVASLVVGAAQLSLRTSRLDLLNPSSPYNQLWLDYLNDFGGEDDAVVVVQGPNRAAVTPILENIAEELNRSPKLFRDVLYKVDLTTLRPKRLHYLTPPQLGQLEHFIQQMRPVAAGDWSTLQLSRMFFGLAQAGQSPDPQVRQGAQQALMQHVDNLNRALAGDGGYQSPWPAIPGAGGGEDPFQTQYLWANDQMGLVLLRLADDGSSFERGGRALAELRAVLKQVGSRHPGVEIGLTGLPVMENDEMHASSDASFKSSIVSLIGVTLVFIIGFGGLRHPLLAVGALLVSLCWVIAYIVFSVGHLNILSMSFGMILIGLGVDFGIHYVARYLYERQFIAESGPALVATAEAVGPGVITGGVTTSLAFYAAGLTEFTGVAELGVITGGGVILCLLAGIFLLPAMIQLSDRKRPGLLTPKLLAVHRWFGFTHHLPRLTLLFAGVVLAVCSLGLDKVWYDHNLLNLQPEGLESVRLEKKLLEETDQSVWYAISLAKSRDELLVRKGRFQSLDSVERVEEIASLLPEGEAVKSPIISRIGQTLTTLPEAPPQISVEPPADVARALVHAQMQLGLPIEGPGSERLRQVVGALQQGQPPEMYRLIAGYQQILAYDLLRRLQGIRDSCDPVGPQLADLPPSLAKRFVGDSGRCLLKVYSKADIWDMDALRVFVEQVRSVDPRATGQPLQTFEASQQMQQSYLHAGLYALIAVLCILMFDFQSVRYSLLALLPVALGMVMMFGLLGLLGLPLNPANMIVLPLILGIGVDNGVHVLHDYRRKSGRYRLSRSTATAVVITSLTTMMGFGSMMIADHRGLESLGRVLTLGVFCCLFMALIPLPALMAWLSRKLPEIADPHDAGRDRPGYAAEPAELVESAS